VDQVGAILFDDRIAEHGCLLSAERLGGEGEASERPGGGGRLAPAHGDAGVHPIQTDAGKEAGKVGAVGGVDPQEGAGMTGGQDNPGNGRDIHGKEAPRVDFATLVKALGVREERVHVVDALPRNAMGKVQKTKLTEP